MAEYHTVVLETDEPATNPTDQTERSQTSQTTDHVVINFGAEEPAPRTNDHEVAHTE